MDRWLGKVAIVTGAGSGIGAATVKKLAVAGLTTIGLDRSVERVDALKNTLTAEAACRLHAYQCDITEEEEVIRTFALVCEKFGGVDVLVNNAGVARITAVLDAENGQDVRDIFNTNVVGLVHCSREALQSMKKRSVDGHIININSVMGHRVFNKPGLSIYAGSKHTVTALTESMRYDLRKQGSNVKVTSISPGITMTEMVSSFPGINLMPTLQPGDVADAIQYVLSTPPNVQISELTITATCENL